MTDDRRIRPDMPADAIVPSPPDHPPRSLKALADKTRLAADAKRFGARRRIRGAMTEEDGGWLRSRTPAHSLADEVLSVALPLAIQRRLLRNEAVVVAVEVPAADWIDPVADAIATMSQDAVVLRHDGTSRRDHVPTSGNGSVATALADGRPVAGVSQAPACTCRRP